MAIEVSLYPDSDLSVGVVVKTITGKDLEEAITLFEPLTNKMLWLFQKVDASLLEPEKLINLARLVRSREDQRPEGKTCLLFRSDLGVGLGRMYQTHTQLEDSPVEYRVCRTIEEAAAWLELSLDPFIPASYREQTA